MKNVSNEFRKTMNTRTDFYMESDVVFADGTEKELTRENFYLSGNSYTDAAGSSSFPLGVALEKQIQISLVNDKDQFSEYDFYGAEFTVFCCLDLNSGTTEKILLGTFTVTEPETYGSIITVNAVDDMYKGDKDYSTGLTFPMTAGQALRDSCSTCGVTLLDTTFTNDDYVIAEMPEGITHRALWGQCAMLAGGNARMDEYNRLRIISYDFSLFDRAGLNGGIFDTDNPYSSGDTADGGSFNPWDVGDVVDGGTFNEAKDYHVFWKAKNLTVATDDVVITGVQTTVDDETYRFGEEGYILSVTNQLVEGNPQDAVNRIGALIVGARFRPFSMDHTAYPLAEVGDVCFVVDRKQNTYQAIVTDVNFTFFGFTTLQCQADNPIRNSSKYNSQLTQAIVQSRLNTEKQITEYDKAVQMMTSIMANSMGMFETREQTENGGVIIYQHNKPTLEESDIIWRKSEMGFQVSTDGGDTWNAGMTADGNAVVNVLSAIGINFDWARGGTLTLGGQNNTNGSMTVLNASGAKIAGMDVNGILASAGAIAGWEINASQIYKVIDLYDDMSSSGLANVGANEPVQYWVWMRAPVDSSTWVFAICYKRKSDYLAGNDTVYRIFATTAAGVVTADTFNSANANITGGKINIMATGPSYNSIYLTYPGDYGIGATSFNGNWLFGELNDARAFLFNTGAMNGSPSGVVDGQFQTNGDIYAFGNIGCSGTKSRLANTQDYGQVLQYCYETPSPMFGDIGGGIIGNDGLCYIYFDAVFLETISANCTYYVFIQNEGEGDAWIAEKSEEYFVVKGTPGLPFAWEVKARQREYEYHRLDVWEDPSNQETEPNMDALASIYLSNYEKELLNYEEIN